MNTQQMQRLSGVLLVLGVVIAALAIHLLQAGSEESILANEAAMQWRALSAVLPAELRDVEALSWPEQEALPEFLLSAFRGADGSFVVLRGVAESCYVERLEFAIAIDREGQVLGLRVLQHAETPGIGARVVETSSRWLQQFTGVAAQMSERREWSFARDGGHFDAMSGATLTSACVLEGAGRALRWYSRWAST